MTAEIRVLPVTPPDTPDHIFQYLQGMVARAYNQEILQLEVRYLTRENGWDGIKIK